MSAKLFETNCKIREVKPKNGKKFTLKELQELVGGYIAIIKPTEDFWVIADDEGKVKNLPVNLHASNIAKIEIYGPAVIIHPEQI